MQTAVSRQNLTQADLVLQMKSIDVCRGSRGTHCCLQSGTNKVLAGQREDWERDAGAPEYAFVSGASGQGMFVHFQAWACMLWKHWF